jgi:adenosine deaminase
MLRVSIQVLETRKQLKQVQRCYDFSMHPSRIAIQAETHNILHALPKVELHCHLLGTVRKQTFTDLVNAAKAPIAQEEITAFYTRGEKPVGVLRVLRALDQWLLRSPDDFHRIAYEYLQDAASHNVRYAEFFWNPTGTANVGGLAYAVVLPALKRGMRDAEKDFGIASRLIPSIDREASEQVALEMVQWVIDERCDEVPGVGMDYRENDHPPEKFIEAYALARKHGLKTTAHAGEFGMPWRNVQTALQTLQVDRIDHAYTIMDHPPLVQWARDQGMVFTVVPTNSYYLRTLPPERWALDHPIRAMLAAGLKLHPNTDDPTLHHVTPTGAWQMMMTHFGATWDDMEQFMHNGLDAAWIDDSTRQAWKKSWQTEFDGLKPATQGHLS